MSHTYHWCGSDLLLLILTGDQSSMCPDTLNHPLFRGKVMMRFNLYYVWAQLLESGALKRNENMNMEQIASIF